MPDVEQLSGAGGAAVVRNEFAIVAVEVIGPPGRRRLRIEDRRTSAAIELDALELESLAWASHADLDVLLDPNLTRWPSEDVADARHEAAADPLTPTTSRT